MIAILSDIHGNLEALQAVMCDAKSRGVENFYCLGDTVGFGPDPGACLEIVQSFELCLSGNWDYFVAGVGDMHSRRGQRVLDFWRQRTRSQLTTSQISFLAKCHSVHRIDERTYAHGDPLDSVNGYLFPETVYSKTKMDQYYAKVDEVFFCGHTHLGGVFQMYRFTDCAQFEGRFSLDHLPTIINVGSVGLPRDEDPRACYLIDYGQEFEFVRVPFDVDANRRKLDGLGGPS